MDESVLGGAVQELNKLTLITDMGVRQIRGGPCSRGWRRPASRPPDGGAGPVCRQAPHWHHRGTGPVTRELAEEICAALRKQGLCEGPRPHRQLLCGPGPRVPSGWAEAFRTSAPPWRKSSPASIPPGHPAENAHGGNVTARADPEKLQTEAFRSPLGAGRPQVLLHRLL